jgi:hypothetical protein
MAKQPEDKNTLELPLARRGRPPKGGGPMTNAERQRRFRESRIVEWREFGASRKPTKRALAVSGNQRLEAYVFEYAPRASRGYELAEWEKGTRGALACYGPLGGERWAVPLDAADMRALAAHLLDVADSLELAGGADHD